MKHPFKGAGSYIVMLAVIYLVVVNWAAIKAAIAPALASAGITPAPASSSGPPSIPGNPFFDAGYNNTFGGGVNLAQIRGPAITGLPHGSVKCIWIGGGALGGGVGSCGEVSLQQGWHPPLQE